MEHAVSVEMATAAEPALRRQHDHRWLVLAVLGLAQLMVVLDATIVNIALPSVALATVHGYITAFRYSALFLGIAAVVAAVILRSGSTGTPAKAETDFEAEPVHAQPLVDSARATTFGSATEQPIAS